LKKGGWFRGVFRRSWFLLTRVSGVPMLERAAMKKWGDHPAYLQMLASTWAVLPKLW
jgi:hypothetical protein